MSLADLKNKGTKLKPPKKLSIEEFIEGANDYAKGGKSAQKKSEASTSEYKRATFTLTHHHIELLNQLAERTGMAKSKLLRMMIQWCSDLKDNDKPLL